MEILKEHQTAKKLVELMVGRWAAHWVATLGWWLAEDSV
jgi:hypothetical protein